MLAVSESTVHWRLYCLHRRLISSSPTCFYSYSAPSENVTSRNGCVYAEVSSAACTTGGDLQTMCVTTWAAMAFLLLISFFPSRPWSYWDVQNSDSDFPDSSSLWITWPPLHFKWHTVNEEDHARPATEQAFNNHWRLWIHPKSFKYQNTENSKVRL